MIFSYAIDDMISIFQIALLPSKGNQSYPIMMALKPSDQLIPKLSILPEQQNGQRFSIITSHIADPSICDNHHSIHFLTRNHSPDTTEWFFSCQFRTFPGAASLIHAVFFWHRWRNANRDRGDPSHR